MRHEDHDLHGTGPVPCEVYDLCPRRDYWPSVTDVPCPVKGCDQTVIWYEAGYVPGYRVCARLTDGGGFLVDTIRHHFFTKGHTDAPKLVRVPGGNR